MSKEAQRKEAVVDPLLRDDDASKPKKKPEDDWPEKKRIAKDDKKLDDGLSEEDLAKKLEFDELVKRIVTASSAHDDLAELRRLVDQVGAEIRTATSSMTSVPKPLKFLRPHFATLRAAYDGIGRGGKDRDELFLTAGDKVWKRKLKVKGALPFEAPFVPPAPRL